MSPINGHRPGTSGGFSLVELMVALSLGTIVIAGIIAAYLFLGRNLTRMVNLQQQEVKSRRALRMFTEDLSSATALTTCTDSEIVLSKPTAGSSVTITYTYTSGSGGTGTLSRTESGVTTVLVTNLSSFDFNYYSESGGAVTSSPQSVKSVEFAFTSIVGTSTSGTRVNHTTVSPRVVLRNKALLAN